MDIKPVRRPQQPISDVQPRGPVPTSPITSTPQSVATPVTTAPTQPVNTPTVPMPVGTNNRSVKKGKKRNKLLIILAGIIAACLIGAGAFWVWYQTQLSPVDASNKDKVVITIAPATTPNEIAAILKENGVIRNEWAFSTHARLEGVQNSLQAGSYRISPSETTPEVVTHLVKGSVDTFSLTFYPGATLVDTVTKEENRIDVTSVLLKAGYSQDEITTALTKTYDSPLFAGKPADATLEGYVFGETYEFTSGSSVEDILNRTFEEFYSYIVKEDLVNAYEAQGLTLYQGITLASIIQRESGGDDKAQIANVFYNRLSIGMQLGSDVTYQYIADKTGVQRDPSLDSPYNTRRYTGLPPGPIATPGLASLRATGNPSEGDNLYFLSGDDNVTYYGRTLEEHEANIVNHCKSKCQIL
jgi:UPF0755 protein